MWCSLPQPNSLEKDNTMLILLRFTNIAKQYFTFFNKSIKYWLVLEIVNIKVSHFKHLNHFCDTLKWYC